MTHKERYERRLRIIERVKSGESINKVSKEESLSVIYIQHICYFSNVIVPRNSLTYNKPKSVLTILGLLFTTKLSITQIAEKLHISKERVSQVYRGARKEGVPIPVRVQGKKRIAS